MMGYDGRNAALFRVNMQRDKETQIIKWFDKRIQNLFMPPGCEDPDMKGGNHTDRKLKHCFEHLTAASRSHQLAAGTEMTEDFGGAADGKLTSASLECKTITGSRAQRVSTLSRIGGPPMKRPSLCRVMGLNVAFGLDRVRRR